MSHDWRSTSFAIYGLVVWVYSGNEWLITKWEAPHVAREA
jgi:hypothetical protein